MDSQQLKQWMYNRALAEARGFGFEVDEALSSCSRPWGGFLRIKESSYAAFAKAYWNGVEIPTPGENLRLDPKILLVVPGARLSLQYHHRRQEHWRVLDGPVIIVRGKDADTLESREYQPGEVIRLACGEWHRLVGANTWGRIAEIWHHADAANPSDENDIVRVEDDYGR